MLATSYAAAGGWEKAEDTLVQATAGHAIDDAEKKHDSGALLWLHAVLLAPPFVTAIFVLGNLISVLVLAPKVQQDLSLSRLQQPATASTGAAPGATPPVDVKPKRKRKRKGKKRRRRKKKKKKRRRKKKERAPVKEEEQPIGSPTTTTEEVEEDGASAVSSSTVSSSSWSSWTQSSSSSSSSSDGGEQSGAQANNPVPDTSSLGDRKKTTMELLKPLKRPQSRIRTTHSAPMLHVSMLPSRSGIDNRRRGSVHAAHQDERNVTSSTTRKSRTRASAAADDPTRLQSSTAHRDADDDDDDAPLRRRRSHRRHHNKGKGKGGGKKKKRKMSEKERRRLKLRRKENRARRRRSTNLHEADGSRASSRGGTQRRLSDGYPNATELRSRRRRDLSQAAALGSRVLQWEHRAQRRLRDDM